MAYNETVDFMKRKKEKGLIFKVDFEKAYDSLNWGFLDEVLGKMGLGSKWRHWMSACLRSASISLLANGSPTEEFRMEREVLDKVILYHLSCLFWRRRG